VKSQPQQHRSAARPQYKLLSLALASCLPFASLTVHGDELEDLKAQIQALSNRLSELEAAKAPKAAAEPTAAVKTDQDGKKMDPAGSNVTLYNNGNTSLKMYGLVEATVSRATNQGPSGQPASGFQVAWFSGNRLGFDVEHGLGFGKDLGMPDLKVISKLESEFELPTGDMDTANVLFNRDAWVGLYSDSLGKLTLGRQNTLTRDFTNTWGDPYGAAEVTTKEGGYSNVNNFKQFIFYSGGPTGTRYNSAIEWKKKFDDDHVVVGAAYAFGSAGAGGSGDVGNGGSIPGDFTNGTAQAVSVAYNHLELADGVVLNANVSYDRGNNHDLISQSEMLGGNIVVGPFRLNAGFGHYTAQQGVNNSAGTRTDTPWTVSMKYTMNQTDFALGYQQMKGKHAGFNGGGKIINPFGNTSGVTTVADGSRNTVYTSVMYHADSQTDFYVAADYLKVTGDWVFGDALGNGNKFGAGQQFKGETELATGVRFKF